jgi:uncharacterized repeat protein (TIGR01451 family)
MLVGTALLAVPVMPAGAAPVALPAAPIESPDALPVGRPLRSPGPEPFVSISGVPANPFLGETFTITLTFENVGDAVGYGPYIDLYLPVTGVDGDDGIDLVASNITYLGFPLNYYERTFNASGQVTNHPLSYQAGTGNPIPVTGGQPGDTLVIIELPFGSFVPGQPPAEVSVTLQLSQNANVDASQEDPPADPTLNIYARGGFRFGATPLNDWCCGSPPDATILIETGDVPTWPGESLIPTVMTVDKSFDGAEGEIPAGPNFAGNDAMPFGSYTLSVDVADGQTVAGVTLEDTLPAQAVFVGTDVGTCGTAPCCDHDGSPTGGTLTCNLGDVDGSTDAQVIVYFYVPDGVVAQADGTHDNDDVLATNTCAVTSGSWTPSDGDDAPPALSGVCAPPCTGSADFSAESISVQKNIITGPVTVDFDSWTSPPLNDVEGYIPSMTVQYTLTFEISDYHAFQDIVVTDVLSDGQHFDPTFTPTLSVTEHGGTSSGNMTTFNFGPGAGTDVMEYYTGGNPGVPAPAPYSNGDTVLTFRVSDEMYARGGSVDIADAQLLGGCVQDPANAASPDCSASDEGPTFGVITYRVVLQENYTDAVGDVSVDHGDSVDNSTEIAGELLNPATLAGTGELEYDDSSADITITRGETYKEVYAVGGDTDPGSWPAEIPPGETITYRIRYTLPSTDTENLYIDDYLPLPVLEATEISAYIGTCAAGTAPAAGEFCVGPDDTFVAASGLAPSLTAPNPPWAVPPHATNPDGAANRVTFYYGTFDGGTSVATVIDLLFTVTVQPDPFTDMLYLANLAEVSESNTVGPIAPSDAIDWFRIGEPVLVTTKTVVATDSTSPDFAFTGTPPTANFPDPPYVGPPRWDSGTITDPADVGDAGVRGMEGEDIVTFALVISNSGHSPNGAFDITIRDVLQYPEFELPGTVAPLNLQVAWGDGTPFTLGGAPGYTGIAGPGDCTGLPWNPAAPNPCGPDNIADTDDDIFGWGFEIIDPGIAQGACEMEGVTPGRHIIIITYDLRITPGILPNTVITNTGHVMSYAGVDGGASTGYDHLPYTPDDDLTDSARVVIGSHAGKEAYPLDVTVGETSHVTIQVEIPPHTHMRSYSTTPGEIFVQDSLLNNGMHALPLTGGDGRSIPVVFTPLSSCDPTVLDSTFESLIHTEVVDTPGGEDIFWYMPEIDNTNGSTSCSFQVEYDVVIVDEDIYDGGRDNWTVPTVLRPAPTADIHAEDDAVLNYGNGTGNSSGDLTFSSGAYQINVDQPVIDLEKQIMEVYASDGTTARGYPNTEVRRGDYIVWQVRMENVGESDAFEVTFTDHLSPYQQYVNGSAFRDDNMNGVQDLTEPNMPNPSISGSPTTTGQTLTFNYQLDILWEDDGGTPEDERVVYIVYRTRALNNMPLGTILSNDADADWSTMDGSQPYERVYDDDYDTGGPLDGFDTNRDMDADMVQGIGLTLDKEFVPPIVSIYPTGVAPNESTLVFTITNPNEFTDLTDVSYTDQLPAGTSISGTPTITVGTVAGPDCNDTSGDALTVVAAANTRNISVSGVDVPALGTCVITLEYVVGSAANIYNNETSRVTSDETGPGETAAATLIVADDLSVYKAFSPSSITVGGTSTMTFTVFSPDGDNNITVTDTLPAGLTAVAVGTNDCGGTVDITTTPGQVTADGFSLGAGAYCQFTVLVGSDRASTYPNFAVVESDDSPAFTSNTATLRVSEIPVGWWVVGDPTFSKNGQPETAVIGETVMWTITIHNPSSIPMNPVFVNDPIPTMLTIVGVTSTHGTATWSGQVVTVNIGQLNPGETAVVQVETIANELAVPGEVCNVAALTFTRDTGGGPVTSERTMEDCITMYPGLLPGTGFRPPAWAWWTGGVAMLGALAGGWLLIRRRRRL